jgi:hypothetical protein
LDLPSLGVARAAQILPRMAEDDIVRHGNILSRR